MASFQSTLRNSFETLTTNDICDIEHVDKQDGDILVWDAESNNWKLYHGLFSRIKAASLLWYGTFGSNGIHKVVYGGEEREMNIDFYGGKAYLEVLVSKSQVLTEPWDNWVDGSNKLKSYNLAPHKGLNYETGDSSVCIAPEICTSLLITAKTSYTAGINHNEIASTTHLSTANRAEFIDYFTGQIPGFEQLDTFGLYDTHLGYRAGSIADDEWLIKDSIEGTKIGGPRWGYRSTGAEKAARAANTEISENNVLSVWISNY